MDACDESMDIIVLPESCDVPCLATTREETERSSAKFTARILDNPAETARRCNAKVFVNARSTENGALRNTTYAFNRRSPREQRSSSLRQRTPQRPSTRDGGSSPRSTTYNLTV